MSIDEVMMLALRREGNVALSVARCCKFNHFCRNGQIKGSFISCHVPSNPPLEKERKEITVIDVIQLPPLGEVRRGSTSSLPYQWLVPVACL